MVIDQARNLRMLAEKKGIGKRLVPGTASTRRWGRRMIILAACAVAAGIFFVQISAQREFMKLVDEKNRMLEQRLLLMGLQIEEMKIVLKSGKDEGPGLKERLDVLRKERDAALQKAGIQQENVLSFEQEMQDIKEELSTFRTQQLQMNEVLAGNIEKTLGELEGRAGEMTSELERIRQSGEAAGAVLGTVLSFEQDFSVVIVGCSPGITLKKGQYVAVHNGTGRVAVLKVAEVRGSVVACIPEELWAAMEKGYEVRPL